jgi:hypothetical protein
LAPCPNCGFALAALPSALFCPQCGQETRLQTPTLVQFGREFFTHYGAADGALWRTLAALLFRPGHLTRQFVAGRRRYYIGPMRLYLMTSFLFFLSAKLIGGQAFEGGDSPPAPPAPASAPAAAPASAAAQAATSASAEPGADADSAEDTEPPGDEKGNFQIMSVDGDDKVRMEACLAKREPCGWWATQGYKLAKKSIGLKHQSKALKELMLSHAPTAIFFMLPFFAALLQLVYWGRKRAYGEHFVCSLHLHSFWFLGLLAIALLPSGVGKGWIFLVVPFWTLLALRVVYGGTWRGALLRSGFISMCYGIILTFGVAFLGVWAVLAA